jgi:hypothetical protein
MIITTMTTILSTVVNCACMYNLEDEPLSSSYQYSAEEKKS